MMGFLEGGFEIADAVMRRDEDVLRAARRFGYELAKAEDMTPSLRLNSFVHDHEDQRLVLNAHRYPGFVRRVMHLMLPGGLSAGDIEEFRISSGIAGETHQWHGHVYGEWCFGALQTDRDGGEGPVFVEVRQDVLQGEPYLLRVMFHHVARA